MPDPQAVDALLKAWQAIEDRFRTVLGEATVKVELSHTELDGLLGEIRSRVPHEELLARCESLKHEPTSVRFERMKLDIEGLARRLGKPCPKVVVDHHDVRLPASRFGPFWSSSVHMLRNMLDHGLESASERRQAGKPEAGTLTFRSFSTPDHFCLEFIDDGRGIDWGKVRSSAAKLGRPHTTQAHLEQSLFAGGISTAAVVSEVSGRGVGLSAMVERCQDLGGTTSVESSLGRGTKFVFIFPRRDNEHSLIPVARESGVRPSARPAWAV
jgi:two-component system chemotaxis sensor kinase CheA